MDKTRCKCSADTSSTMSQRQSASHRGKEQTRTPNAIKQYVSHVSTHLMAGPGATDLKMSGRGDEQGG